MSSSSFVCREQGTKLSRRRVITLAAGTVTLAASSWTAKAETYPSRPITIVMLFPAGGPTDTLGRILAVNRRGVPTPIGVLMY